MANPTPFFCCCCSKKFGFQIQMKLPCHPRASMNDVAGPRLENWPRANSR